MNYTDKIKKQSNITNVVEDERAGSYDDVSDDLFTKQLQEAEQEARQIVKTGSGVLQIGEFRADAAGFHVPKNATIEELKASALFLFKMQDRIQMWFGDLLLAADDLQYGAIKELAVSIGKNPATLYNWKSIAQSVTISLRSEVLNANQGKKPLTKTHYELVKGKNTDDQRYWLMEASANEWSVSELRRQMQGELPVEIELSTKERKFERFKKQADKLSKSEAKRWIAYLQKLVMD